MNQHTRENRKLLKTQITVGNARGGDILVRVTKFDKRGRGECFVRDYNSIAWINYRPTCIYLFT